jgi:hypothetical protein
MTDAMLGAIFAHLGADEQAAFLNGAGKGLRRCCADSQALDSQACWIVDRLDGNGRDFVKRLASFIQHDEETPQIVKRVVYEDVIEKRPVEFEPEEGE